MKQLKRCKQFCKPYEQNVNCKSCLNEMNEYVFRGCRQQLYLDSNYVNKTDEIKVGVEFYPFELTVKIEDIKYLVKYKQENLDRFDLNGDPLISKKNEFYPMYGGYKGELEYVKSATYGGVYEILTTEESELKHKKAKDFREEQINLRFFNEEFNTEKKYAFDIPDYNNYFKSLAYCLPSKEKEEYYSWFKVTTSFFYKNKLISADEIIPTNYKLFEPLNFSISLDLKNRKWLDFGNKKIFYIN